MITCVPPFRSASSQVTISVPRPAIFVATVIIPALPARARISSSSVSVCNPLNT